MLNNFYIIRILYGAKLFVIDITFGFIIFFYFLFLGLSTAKRSIQVSSNKLKMNNLISPYYVGDLKILKKYFIFFFNYSYNSGSFHLKYSKYYHS